MYCHSFCGFGFIRLFIDWKVGRMENGRLEGWKIGKWEIGRLENGRLECWMVGRLQIEGFNL